MLRLRLGFGLGLGLHLGLSLSLSLAANSFGLQGSNHVQLVSVTKVLVLLGIG